MQNTGHLVMVVLLDLALIIVVARAAGWLFTRLGQPAVVGEIVAGLALGPSLLGAFPGHLDTVLFPVDVRPTLAVIAQVGLVLFMFIVGLEVNPSLMRGRGRVAAGVSFSSIVLPFGLGVLLALMIYGEHDTVGGSTIPFAGFVLFLGIAMSITAFPVLARILTERGLHRVPLGVLALACASIDDVIAWTLLALTVAVVSGGSAWGALLIASATAAYAAFLLGVVRPVFGRLIARFSGQGGLSPNLLAFTLVMVFFSAFVTERIGVHAIFGAFLVGVAIPYEGAEQFRRQVVERIEQVSVLILLPVFFVTAGLSANVLALDITLLAELALILLVACVGKFVGAFAAARANRVPTRASVALGILMNTRGLTELVILQVGLDLGVLDESLYTMLLLMAIVTTVMASPLLRVAYPPRVLQREIAAQERSSVGGDVAHRVLVVLDGRASDGSLVALGADLARAHAPGEVVLSRLVPLVPRQRQDLGAGLADELGTIADAADDVQALAEHVRARGLGSATVSRFSADLPADLLEQVDNLGAELVLMAGDAFAPAGEAHVTARVLDAARCTVAVLSLPGPEVPPAPPGGVGPTVAVVPGRDADGKLALRYAVTVAAARHGTVALAGGAADARRVRRLLAAEVDRASRAGLTVRVADGHDERGARPDLLVRGIDVAGTEVERERPDGRPPVPVLRVRAGSESFDRIPAGAGSL